MHRDHRVGLLLIALSVVAFTAHSTRGYLLVDACRDAGGRYLREPPRCEVGGAGARRLGTLPQRRGAWLLTLGPACLAGGAVYALGRAALRRTTGHG